MQPAVVGKEVIDLYSSPDKFTIRRGGRAKNISNFLHDIGISNNYFKLLESDSNSQNIDLPVYICRINQEGFENEVWIDNDIEYTLPRLEEHNRYILTDIPAGENLSYEGEIFSLPNIGDIKSGAIRENLEDLDYLIMNEQEWELLEPQVKEIPNSTIFAITYGEEGSKINNGKNSFQISSIGHDDIISTIGAGDAYAAGFIGSILKNKDLEKAGQTGSAMAKTVLENMGPYSEIESYKEVEKIYERFSEYH